MPWIDRPWLRFSLCSTAFLRVWRRLRSRRFSCLVARIHKLQLCTIWVRAKIQRVDHINPRMMHRSLTYIHADMQECTSFLALFVCFFSYFIFSCCKINLHNKHDLFVFKISKFVFDCNLFCEIRLGCCLPR